MSNIVLSQPGGVGTLTADGNVEFGTRCYLSGSGGVTAVSWTVLSKPAGSSAVARLEQRLGWYFDPDVPSQVPYVIQMTDSLSVVHSNSFTAPAREIKADGRQITDGILSAGSNVLQSASGAFVPADRGKAVLVRTPSNPLPAGTVTLGIGNVLVMGAGTAMLTDIPNIESIPSPGGCVYIDGEYFSILTVEGDAQLHVTIAPTHNAAGVRLYRETQLRTSIAEVIDATHVRLACSASAILVSESGVLATFGTDDTSALHATITAAFANHVERIDLPSGIICVSQNLYYANQSGLTISGQGLYATILVDLRLASEETLIADRVYDNYGVLSFKGCSQITVQDLSFDGSIPVVGMAHTTGGIANNSGGRVFLFFRESNDTTVLRIGAQRYGSRDEYIYGDAGAVPGTQRNFRVEECDLFLTNGNSINPANVGKGCVVRGNRVASGNSCLQIAADSALVADNVFTAGGGFTEGTGVDPVVIEQLTGSSMLFVNNAIVNSDTHAFGVALVHVYGLGTGADSTCVLTISGNQYFNNYGYFTSFSSAIIRVHEAKGTVVITNETFDKNTAISGGGGGTFIEVDGATTGRVIIGPCVFRGRGGSEMTRGIVVAAAVPTSAVTILPGSFFGESVTTKWSLGAVCEFPVDRGLMMEELTVDPPAPPTNQAVFYLKDNGAGKTTAYIRFATGAIQQVSIEP